jgi:predicted membrane protein
MSEWWPIQSTGMIFGIAGGACGVLGGIFGTAVGLLVRRCRGKPFVYCCLALLCAISIGSIGLGVMALVIGQARHVWMWPMLLGFVMLMSALPSGLMIPRWYRQAERRKLEAAGLRRGL